MTAKEQPCATTTVASGAKQPPLNSLSNIYVTCVRAREPHLWLYALMSTAGDDAEAEDAETEDARMPALGGTASIVSLHMDS